MLLSARRIERSKRPIPVFGSDYVNRQDISDLKSFQSGASKGFQLLTPDDALRLGADIHEDFGRAYADDLAVDDVALFQLLKLSASSIRLLIGCSAVGSWASCSTNSTDSSICFPSIKTETPPQ